MGEGPDRSVELRYFIRLPQSEVKFLSKPSTSFLVPHSLSNLLNQNLSSQIVAVVIINIYWVLSVCQALF